MVFWILSNNAPGVANNALSDEEVQAVAEEAFVYGYPMVVGYGVMHDFIRGEGWTALMFAAGEGQEAVCKVLLGGGADRALKDKDGDTALVHAQSNKHQKVVELLSK